MEKVNYFLQQLINGISCGSIYAMIAIGYSMVYGLLYLVNFAHGDLYVFGTFIAYSLMISLASKVHPLICCLIAFRSELSRCGMIQSLSGTGHCFDNARMESFFATLKKEKIYQIAAYKLPREQVKTIIFRYVFIYYNRVRIYTRNPLGLPPVKYREWAQAQTAA